MLWLAPISALPPLFTPKSAPHLGDDGQRRGPTTKSTDMCRRLPRRMDPIMVTAAQRDELVVVLVAEVAVVQVVQVDGPRAADDADGEFVGSFPVFLEPAAPALGPGLAVDVVGVPATAGPSAGCPRRARAGRAHVSPPRPVRRPPAPRRRFALMVDSTSLAAGEQRLAVLAAVVRGHPDQHRVQALVEHQHRALGQAADLTGGQHRPGAGLLGVGPPGPETEQAHRPCRWRPARTSRRGRRRWRRSRAGSPRR